MKPKICFSFKLYVLAVFIFNDFNDPHVNPRYPHTNVKIVCAPS